MIPNIMKKKNASYRSSNHHVGDNDKEGHHQERRRRNRRKRRLPTTTTATTATTTQNDANQCHVFQNEAMNTSPHCNNCNCYYRSQRSSLAFPSAPSRNGLATAPSSTLSSSQEVSDSIFQLEQFFYRSAAISTSTPAIAPSPTITGKNIIAGGEAPAAPATTTTHSSKNESPQHHHHQQQRNQIQKYGGLIDDKHTSNFTNVNNNNHYDTNKNKNTKKGLDLYYVSNNIIAMAAPYAATKLDNTQIQQQQQQQQQPPKPKPKHHDSSDSLLSLDYDDDVIVDDGGDGDSGGSNGGSNGGIDTNITNINQLHKNNEIDGINELNFDIVDNDDDISLIQQQDDEDEESKPIGHPKILSLNQLHYQHQHQHQHQHYKTKQLSPLRNNYDGGNKSNIDENNHHHHLEDDEDQYYSKSIFETFCSPSFCHFDNEDDDEKNDDHSTTTATTPDHNHHRCLHPPKDDDQMSHANKDDLIDGNVVDISYHSMISSSSSSSSSSIIGSNNNLLHEKDRNGEKIESVVGGDGIITSGSAVDLDNIGNNSGNISIISDTALKDGDLSIMSDQSINLDGQVTNNNTGAISADSSMINGNDDNLDDEDKVLRQQNNKELPTSATTTSGIPPSSQLPKGNCPATLSTFLSTHHQDHYLIFNISSSEPSSRTKYLLDNQIVNIPWHCPGILMSSRKCSKELLSNDESGNQNLGNIDAKNSPDCPTAASIPTLECLLDICYAIHAYISLDPLKNTAAVYCSNGKTRTGIAIAAYLKYSCQTLTSLHGFRLFCAQSCPDLVDMDEIDDLVPPSLKTLFRNFDSLIECCGTIQTNNLTLRAITLQGIPADDMPRIDIWDGHGLVFSSHHMEQAGGECKDHSKNSDDLTMSSQKSSKQSLMWTDEEGFYRINKPLCSDFLLLCRFGGQYAQDTKDPTKVIFRYANNTCFLYKGPLALSKSKVDIMRRYSESVEEDDFLISFLFDQFDVDEEESDICDCNSIIPLEGKYALHRGWELISMSHCLESHFTLALTSHDSNTTRELNEYFSILQHYYQGSVEAETLPYASPNDLLITIAIQLSNGDIDRAVEVFLEKQMKQMWKDISEPFLFTLPIREHDINNTLLGKEIPQSLSTVREVDSGDFIVHIETENESLNGDERDRKETVTIKSKIGQLDKIEKEFLNTLESIDFSFGESERNDKSISRVNESINDVHPHCYSNLNYFPTQGDICGLFHVATPFVDSFPRRSSYMTDELNVNLPFQMPTKRTMKEDDRYERVISNLNTFVQISSPEIGNQSFDLDESEAEIFLQSHLLCHDDVDLIELFELTKATKYTRSGPDESSKALQTSSLANEEEYPLSNEDHMIDCTVILPRKKMKENVEHREKGHMITQCREKNPRIERSINLSNELDCRLSESPPRENMQATLLVTNLKNNNSDYEEIPRNVHDHLEKTISLKCNDVLGKDLPIGSSVSVVIDDKPREGCTIESKSCGYYTVRIPINAVSGGEVVLTEKSTHQNNIESTNATNIISKDKEKKDSSKSVTTSTSEKFQKNQIETSKPTDVGKENEYPLNQDPEYAKYFKMLKMGLPVGAVKNALTRDGKDPSIMDLDPNKSLKSQTDKPDEDEKDTGPPLHEDPEYIKYFKMLKMGLPVGAVKNALTRDGKDPSIMDLDPNKSLSYQRKKKNPKVIGKVREQKPKVRRKKIYWNAIDNSKVKEDSIWGQIQGMVDMEKLDYDSSEFESLFTESLDPSQKKDKKKATTSNKTKQKKSVQVIEGKRGMNGGIILARLKMDFSELANIIDHM